MKTKLYLDTRRVLNDGNCPLKISLSHNGRTAYVPTNVSLRPSQWDANLQIVIKHPAVNKINVMIAEQKIALDEFIRDRRQKLSMNISVMDLRDLYLRHMNGNDKSTCTMFSLFEDVMRTRNNAATAKNYKNAMNVLLQFDPNADKLLIDEIDRKWAKAFFYFLKGSKYVQNTQASILSACRYVFNYALDEDLVDYTPFAGLSIPIERGKHRALTVEQFKQFWNLKGVKPGEDYALDVLRLSFLLRGMNLTDMFGLKMSTIVNGRMYYRRSKTYGHLSILVEPEIRELMDRVSDEKNLISRRGEYQAMMSFVNRNAGKACVRVGLPKITSYWMRHSYATLLYELSKFDRNITKDDISMCLGHSFGVRVTDTYIQYTNDRTDYANRAMIDWIKRDIEK